MATHGVLFDFQLALPGPSYPGQGRESALGIARKPIAGKRLLVAPTLVIGAQHDTQRPSAMAERVAKAIPGAKYLLADSGHFMNVETPQLFAETALGFMRDH